MLTYLADGWYSRVGPQRLRDAVVDGAIDSARHLFDAGVTAPQLTRLALKLRALAAVVDPPHRQGRAGSLSGPERQALAARLRAYAGPSAALAAFVDACLKAVRSAGELRAMTQHLQHITQMLQLLLVARLSGALPPAPVAAPEAAAG